VQPGGGAENKVRQLEREVEEARRVLASKEQLLYAWQRGLDGERRTGEVLASLETAGWVVLHDLHWPGRPFANIDHIAIGPAGVFVIDSKYWAGSLVVRDGVLRQNGNRRSDACEGAAAATAAVAAYLEPQHRSLASGVLCLVDQPTPQQQPTQVQVVGLADLPALLAGGTERLSPWDVARIGEYLNNLLGGPKSPPMKTTAALASAGVAPREPVRVRYRRRPSPIPTSRARPPSRRSARHSPSRGGDGVVFTFAKVAVMLFLVVVVLPKVWPAVSNNLFDPPATNKPPAVVQPSVTSPPKVPAKTKPAVRKSAVATKVG
jgi:Nuclease-related domain